MSSSILSWTRRWGICFRRCVGRSGTPPQNARQEPRLGVFGGGGRPPLCLEKLFSEARYVSRRASRIEARREREPEASMRRSRRAIAALPELPAIQGISAVSKIGWVNRDAWGSEASR